MASWYCAIDGQQYGPLSTEELRDLAEQGRLRPTDHVRPTESEQWTKAAKVRGLFSATAKPRAKTGPPPIAGSKAPPVARPASPTTALPTAIPLQPVAADPIDQGHAAPVTAPFVNIAADAPATEDHGFRRDRRPSAKQQNLRIVVGLSVALLVLMVAALLLMGRSRPASRTAAERAEKDPAPAATADPETDPVTTILEDSTAPQVTKDESRPLFPPIRRWVTAGTQKRVVGDSMRLHVPAAWWAADPSPDRTLVVQVEITNRSADRPLHYTGWAACPGVQNRRLALLAVTPDEPPVAAHASRDALTDSAQPQQVTPGQTVTRNLEFSLSPDAEVECFRLMLPYEAWGLSGEVGFEIPDAMVLDSPPDVVAAHGQQDGLTDAADDAADDAPEDDESAFEEPPNVDSF